jgi:hypothetical protein
VSAVIPIPKGREIIHIPVEHTGIRPIIRRTTEVGGAWALMLHPYSFHFRTPLCFKVFIICLFLYTEDGCCTTIRCICLEADASADRPKPTGRENTHSPAEHTGTRPSIRRTTEAGDPVASVLEKEISDECAG